MKTTMKTAGRRGACAGADGGDRQRPGAVLVDPGARRSRRQQKMRDSVLANFPGGVDFQPQEAGPVHHPHRGRGARPARARSASSARCTATSRPMPTTGPTSRDIDLDRRQRQPGLPRARQARHRRAEVPALDAGELRDGRQQAGAAVPAGRRRHQRADLRPADRLVPRRMAEGDRLAEVRLPGRTARA